MVVLWMMLAVPLMGSDCSAVARVGGPPPPPPGTDPPPSGGGGGVIIVTSGDSSATSSSAEAARIDRTLVAAALEASVWTPPDFARASRIPERFEPTDLPLAEVTLPWTPGESGLDLPAPIPDAPASTPVPEPTGVLLFAIGLGVASSLLERRLRSRSPIGARSARSGGG